MIAVQIQNVTDFNLVSTSVKTTGRVTSNTGYKLVHQLSLPAKTVHHILSKNRDLMVFMWLSFLGFLEIRHTVLRYMYINLLLVNTLHLTEHVKSTVCFSYMFLHVCMCTVGQK